LKTRSYNNLGPKASAVNDDNLVIIENDAAVAEQYAVNIMGVYDQYRRAFMQPSYFTGDKAKELKFWM
jgi:hypothetical protein